MTATTATRISIIDRIRRHTTWLVAALLPLLGAGALSSALSSCGGGVAALALGGVGTGGTGLTIGTVVALGSVGVDDHEYDSQAPQYYEDGNATATPATVVGLGQRIHVETDAANNPLTMTVEPTLVGTIQGTPTIHADGVTGSFVVNGVTVVTNIDPAAGPVTFYVGLTDITSLADGTRVQVHGLFHGNAGGTGNTIQATRIALSPATDTATRITGVVTGLAPNATGESFQIAGSGMTVQMTSATPTEPAGAALANGQVVNVLSATAPSGTMIAADNVRIHGLAGTTTTAAVEGLASGSGGVFTVDGVAVDATAPGLPAVHDGDAIVVTGQEDANGTLHASAIRAYATQPAQVRLKGTITGYVSDSRFLVRGVPVDAGGVVVTTVAGGTPAALGNGVYVEITGNPGGSGQGDVVVAASVASSSVPPVGAVVDYLGTIGGFVGDASPFTLRGTFGGVTDPTVTLTDNVQTVNGTEGSLADGKAVEVEGTVTANGLTVYSLTFLGSAPTPSDTNGVVHGYVAGGSAFTVNGIVLTLTGATMFYDGTATSTPPPWFTDGAPVEVNYTQSGGQNLAQSINFDGD